MRRDFRCRLAEFPIKTMKPFVQFQRHVDVILLVIVACGIFARLYGISEPIRGHHEWRQADTAAVARNFYEESMNILYPRVDWRGNSPGYVESEFQIYTFLVAVSYYIFGPHEWLGSAFNITVYALSALVLFFFISRLSDEYSALLAVFFYSFVPLTFYFTRTFQPDALMAFFSLVGVYYFWIWTEQGRRTSIVISGL